MLYLCNQNKLPIFYCSVLSGTFLNILFIKLQNRNMNLKTLKYIFIQNSVYLNTKESFSQKIKRIDDKIIIQFIFLHSFCRSFDFLYCCLSFPSYHLKLLLFIFFSLLDSAFSSDHLSITEVHTTVISCLKVITRL